VLVTPLKQGVYRLLFGRQTLAFGRHTAGPSAVSLTHPQPTMTVALILLLACGALGAACGWSLGSNFVGRPNRKSFDPPGPKRWRIVLTFAFSLAYIALVLTMLIHFEGL
jgi:hypothetical protein